IGVLVSIEYTFVVDEGAAEHEAALFIDQEVLAIAHALVEAVVAVEKGLVTAVRGELLAVLGAMTLRTEPDAASQSPIIPRQGRKIGIGLPDQVRARDALGRGQHLVEFGIVA